MRAHVPVSPAQVTQAGAVVGAAPAMSKAEAEAGMRAKSEEFLAEGGKLYVDAAE